MPRVRLPDLEGPELVRLDRGRVDVSGSEPGPGTASRLDLKREIARRAASSCSLCAWACGIDRARGEHGRCGLGAGASPASPSVHVAEEALINPSLLVPVRGCALRCRGCQQSPLLAPAAEGPLDVLGVTLPERDRSLARTVSFIGGNPDESLPAILDALADGDNAGTLPVAWNTHGWVPPSTIDLLDGVVDVYVTDLKYGDDACAAAISRVPRYRATLHAAIERQALQGVPVVVRVLVLPGHVDCRALPSIEWLASGRLPGVVLSLLPRYVPEWKSISDPGHLGRAVSDEEVDRVRIRAARLGLELADPGLEVSP